MAASDVSEDMARFSRLLDQGLAALRDQARELADAEEQYRIAKRHAWMTAPDGTVPEREAWVDGETAKERHRRDLADHLRQAALEAVRGRRTQISALQSLLAAEREEAAFIRTGPDAA